MPWVKIRNNLHPIGGSFLIFFFVSWRLKATNWLENVTPLQLRTQKKGLLGKFPGLFGGHHRLGVHNSVVPETLATVLSVSKKLQVPCCWKGGSHRSAFIKILLRMKTGYHHEWFVQMWFWDWFVGEFTVETVCCRCQWSWARCHRLAFLP